MKWLLVGWVMFGGLQGADVASSRGQQERNPLMPKSLLAQTAVKATTTAGLLVWTARHPRAGAVLTWGLNAVYVGVVAHNLKERR